MILKKEDWEDLAYSLDPLLYLMKLGFRPYDWQKKVLLSRAKRILINGARQSGKSTIIASKPCIIARSTPGSLCVILAATQKQAYEDVTKVKEFIARDPSYPKVVRDSDELVELSNRSRIVVVPATEKGARGYSSPDLIVIDEASRVEDGVYTSGVRSMLNSNPRCKLILISTPNGKDGFFFRAWKNPKWERYLIRAPFSVDMGRLVETEVTAPEQGVLSFPSPRHMDREEQEEHLREMGERMYRQEMLCDFVEREAQVFGYEEIEGMLNSTAEPLDFGDVKQAPEILRLVL